MPHVTRALARACAQMALRLVCLAAGAGLAPSLRSLELSRFSWGGLGAGAAAPFLALGSSAGPHTLTSVKVFWDFSFRVYVFLYVNLLWFY
jgi:hypothetical protein